MRHALHPSVTKERPSGIFAEFERTMIVERVRVGMNRARSQGKHLGRPITSEHTRRQILERARQGGSRRAIARQMMLGEATVRRVLATSDATARVAGLGLSKALTHLQR